MKRNESRLCKARFPILLLLCFAAAQVWAPLSEAGQARISGTVSYRERIALPPDYVLRVELLDISRQDAPPVPIASVELTPRHQVPVAFDLAYDEDRIDPRLTYAVRAQILAGGRLMFTTTRNYPVITKGNPGKADIWLERAASPRAEAKLVPPALMGEWLVQDIGGCGVLDNLQSTLRFGSNGAASGRGGCNHFTGSFTVSGGELRFGPLAATMKACIPAVADQEQKYFAALSAVRAARIESGVLILAAADGAHLLKLSRL